jgi:hypothetical protein
VHTVSKEFPPGKRLVFPCRPGTVSFLPHDDPGTFNVLLVGNEQDRFGWPHRVDGRKRNRSPANASQSKDCSLHVHFDALHATESSAISPDCTKPLAAFEPVLSHGASPPKTGSTICLDASSTGFEPGRRHRTACLRFAKQASCDRRACQACRQNYVHRKRKGSFRPLSTPAERFGPPCFRPAAGDVSCHASKAPKHTPGRRRPGPS